MERKGKSKKVGVVLERNLYESDKEKILSSYCTYSKPCFKIFALIIMKRLINTPFPNPNSSMLQFKHPLSILGPYCFCDLNPLIIDNNPFILDFMSNFLLQIKVMFDFTVHYLVSLPFFYKRERKKRNEYFSIWFDFKNDTYILKTRHLFCVVGILSPNDFFVYQKSFKPVFKTFFSIHINYLKLCEQGEKSKRIM